MVEEPNFERGNAELEKLRSEFAQVRSDMLSERANRAEHHLGYMRTFLSIYTPTVTLIFLVFALLGYKSYTDVDAESAKVQKTAQEFYITVDGANQKIDAFSTKEKHFEDVSRENDTVVTGVKDSVAEVKGSIVTFQSNLGGLKT
jgi:hypothetical protein